MIKQRISTPIGDIYATYQGGAYIDLSFGVPHKPIEVINVFDYEKGVAVIEDTDDGVATALQDWVNDLDPRDLQTYFDQ